MPEPVTLAVEGMVDAAVARRLLAEAGLEPGPQYVCGGKAALDTRLRGYNNAARFACWLVLRDLDRDAGCAADLRRILLPDPAPRMRLTSATRAVEGWLLADSEAIARALSVPSAAVPKDPESLPGPKLALVELARKSRRRSVREELVPATGTTARVGPGYAPFLIQFAARGWRPEVPSTRSASLARLRAFLARAVRGPAAC